MNLQLSSLSGEGLSVCAPGPESHETPVTISGNCGDGVGITYRDDFTTAAFTGNVECTLT